MKCTLAVAGLVALGLVGLACVKKKGEDGTVTVALEGLGDLEAEMPAGTKVSRDAVGIGVMLKGPGVSTTIGPSQSIDASTLDEAKKNAEAYSPTQFEEEKLSDGYILTYESKGSVGTLYWLVGRRSIEEASYSCGVRSPEKTHQQSAIAICKSLKK